MKHGYSITDIEVAAFDLHIDAIDKFNKLLIQSVKGEATIEDVYRCLTEIEQASEDAMGVLRDVMDREVDTKKGSQ